MTTPRPTWTVVVKQNTQDTSNDQAPVGGEDLSREEIGGGRGQEQKALGHVGGGADALQRGLQAQLLQGLGV